MVSFQTNIYRTNMSKIKTIHLFATLSFFFGVQSLSANPIQVTYGAAGSQTASGAVCVDCVIDFNGLSNGLQNFTAAFGSTGITGTYSGVDIVSADQYGGASGNGKYATVGIQSGTTSYALYLSQPVSYFGLWFSAADAQNNLGFYLGGKKIANFSTGELTAVVGDCSLPTSNMYCGNPNSGMDSAEPFAYVNFFGQQGTTFDEVLFTNGTGSGFESDNHAAALLADSINGTAVQTIVSTPEPSTFLLLVAPGFWGIRKVLRKNRIA